MSPRRTRRHPSRTARPRSLGKTGTLSHPSGISRAGSVSSPSRICHMISNVQILSESPAGQVPAEVAVKSRILVYRNRVETETDVLVGKREDLLRRVDGGWKIA